MSNRRRIPGRRPGHHHEAVPAAPGGYSMWWDSGGVHLSGPGQPEFHLPRGEVTNLISGLAAYLEHMADHHGHDDDLDELPDEDYDTDTLTGLNREVTLIVAGDLPESALFDLSIRIDRFARLNPDLDPETHMRLQVQLARTIDPTVPADIQSARGVIAAHAIAVVRKFHDEEDH